MKSNVIFMKFHTRLQSTDFVIVLVLPESSSSSFSCSCSTLHHITISRTFRFSRTSTKRIRLNRMYTPCALNLIPCKSHETSVSFWIKLAAFQASGGADTRHQTPACPPKPGRRRRDTRNLNLDLFSFQTLAFDMICNPT